MGITTYTTDLGKVLIGCVWVTGFVLGILSIATLGGSLTLGLGSGVWTWLWFRDRQLENERDLTRNHQSKEYSRKRKKQRHTEVMYWSVGSVAFIDLCIVNGILM